MQARPALSAAATVRPRSGLRSRVRANAWSYVYLVPMLALLLVFVIYPSIASVGYTLYTWNGVGSPSAFVGLQNFRDIASDPVFWQSFVHTFIYAGVLVPVQLTLALILALVLNNLRLRGRTFYRAVYFIPVVMAPAVIGAVAQLLLTEFGTNFSQFLIGLHLTSQPVDWLGDAHTALPIVIAVGIWSTLGYNLIYFLAGLQSVPSDLYEAARIDGAGAVAQFIYVTVPALRAVGVVIVLLAVLGSLQVFDLVNVLTQGGPYFATEVVNTYIFHTAFSPLNGGQPNVGFASAAAFFYGLILLALTVALVAVRRLTQRESAES